jgi:O-antigen/teichoic acid export membrane protein
MFKKFSEFLFQKKELLSHIKNAGLYFLGSIVQSILALIAQPIYSLHLSADEFGILGYFDAVKSTLVPIFIFGMSTFFLMRYFKQDEEANKKLLFNVAFYLCCFNTLTLVISYAGIYLYFKYMNVEIPLNPFAWFILIALLLENIKSFVLINYRIRKRALAFFIFSAANSLLNFGLGILFVAYFEWGAEGRLGAPLVSSILLLPVCIYILSKYSSINFDIKVFLNGLKVALPLVLAAYAYVPIETADRFFLERLNDLSEFGLYNIGVTIAGYVLMAYVALGTAVEPDIFKAVAEKDNKKLIKSGLIIFIPYLFFVLLFVFFSQLIISILTAGRYVAATEYANIMIISVFLMGVYWFLDKILIALEKTKMNLIINVLGGVSSIIITYLAVDIYKFAGAAYAKVIVALILSITALLLVIKNLKLAKVIT